MQQRGSITSFAATINMTIFPTTAWIALRISSFWRKRQSPLRRCGRPGPAAGHGGVYAGPLCMYSSKNAHEKFRCTRTMLSDILDMLGTDVRFEQEDEASVTGAVCTNEMALMQFAKRFGPDVVILEPVRLREQMKAVLHRALEEY